MQNIALRTVKLVCHGLTFPAPPPPQKENTIATRSSRGTEQVSDRTLGMWQGGAYSAPSLVLQVQAGLTDTSRKIDMQSEYLASALDA